MPEMLSSKEILRLAGLELNALRAVGVLPETFEKARLTTAGTPIHDLNGELLFHRLPVWKGRQRIGYADVAAHPDLGEPLLATSHGWAWDERALKKQAIAAARKRRRYIESAEIRFVAYSYPKIAVQFLSGGREVLMLELATWEVVPPKPEDYRKPLEPANFERWSLLEELPAKERRSRRRNFEKRLGVWAETSAGRAFRRIDPTRISEATLEPAIVAVRLVDRRELHFSSRDADHHTCYELRGQETNVWCVGASVQMLLDFYRYEYTQDRLATALGLGTKANPNGLPYARVGDVVTQIEALTSNALDATMIVNPGFSTFRDEIRANRPLISFVPGHSRTVAGYTRSLLALVGELPYRGLLVYDPWPPNAGVITRWENFATQIYQYAYKAQVTLA